MMIYKLTNFAAFQLCWAATVLAAAAGRPLLGPLLSLCWLAAHLQWVVADRKAEIRLLLISAIMGALMDSVLVLGAFIAFPPQAALGYPTTLWMVVLWVNLAASLRFSLSWLQDRYAMAALLGLIAGPLAYWAGTSLGAMILPHGPVSLVAISIVWGIAMPALLLAEQVTRGGETPVLVQGDTP